MIELTPVVLSSTPVRRAEPPGVPLQGSELLRVVDAGGHTLLVAEDEVLIPTIWYDICRTQVDRGLDLAWGLA
jgi:hypothetical protein